MDKQYGNLVMRAKWRFFMKERGSYEEESDNILEYDTMSYYGM